MLRAHVLTLAWCAAPLLAGAVPARHDNLCWAVARERGRVFEECGRNASRLLKGWYAFKREPSTGLYCNSLRAPDCPFAGNTPPGVWDYQDIAADSYSSLVFMAYYVDTPAIAGGGTLHQTLQKSIELCATASGMPAPYDTGKKLRLDPGPGREGELVYGAAEWCRDGLIRIAELLGVENDWYRHLEAVARAIMTWADGRPAERGLPGNVEVNGEMLQTLSRLYAMSGDEKYLRWAETIADHYLLGDPIRTIGKTSLVDHGCELIAGLGEIFALECQLQRAKARQYHPGMRRLLDRILETGRDRRTGLWRNRVDLESGQAEGGPPDTWGYVLFAYDNYDQGAGENRYGDAIERPMRYLLQYRPGWGSWDDWSDSYESMLVLWRRRPHVPRVFSWLHWMTERHRSGAGEAYGPYSGDHFDGSTGRTLALHMSLASQGVRAIPFIEGLRLGACRNEGELFLTLECDSWWSGRLCFDRPRSELKGARLNWARINQAPEWFTARPQLRYLVTVDGSKPVLRTGAELIAGIPMKAAPGETRRIRIGLPAKQPKGVGGHK